MAGTIALEPQKIEVREAFYTFGKIGLLSFGGPAGQIAMMHRVLVDEKKWISEERFLHALNFCMLLPGPEAMQLATYLGWLFHGVKGGVIAGLLFILPGACVMLVLSALYVSFGHVPLVEGLLFGLKAAVLAIVLEAVIKVGKRALTDYAAYGIAICAFIAIALIKLPFPLVILIAGLFGFLRYRLTHTSSPSLPDHSAIEPAARGALQSAVVWTVLWLGPLAILLFALGQANVFAAQAAFFSKMAVVTFGGAYAVLAYVAQQAVDYYGWLKPDEMLTGLGLAETTPGPLILVLAFVGFVGGARLSGFDPLTGGLLGGLTALWFTFAPCFLWIFAGAPFVERLRHVGWLKASLAAITAAVVGVIANLAVWFGLHVLFGTFQETMFGPLHLPVLNLSAFDWAASAIALGAAIALIALRINLLVVLGLAALAGILIRLA
ncbi:chromate efflux transporter [Phyllobacterium sp. P30BS-XVII]|uniref:chromate efflux transporter n=1 Tax=Phyllobacterium sp. P30BS-XVII TaxID=2587046 RepID=UPI000DDC1BDF|nr:chromate efflux transporter [Phyllobacterium sp. P30BS-XVII]